MKIYVISGGPGTGKTAIINRLGKEFKILPEAARLIGKTYKRSIGKSIKKIDKRKFQDAIFKLQKKQIENVDKNKKLVFSDRGFGDTIAYLTLTRLPVPKNMLKYAKCLRYGGIFILNFLNFYKKDELRKESKEEQKKIHKEIIKIYKEIGYKPIFVPFMSVKKRVEFIKTKIRL